MKIENFSISMQSEHSKSTQVSNIFEQELLSLSADEDVQNTQTQQIDITNKELEFVQRIEYMMIQQFISSIQTSSSSARESFSLKTRSIEDIQREVMYGGYAANRFNLDSLNEEILHPKEIQMQEISLTQETIQKESLDIQMDGWVQTQTQKIKLNMDISFSSTFVQKHQLTKTMFYDPLVLNFDGELPGLDSKKFSFDIDCDGECDQISKLSEGNGFLALDKNNNNTIDDATELFGAQNGNGFYDLARYDDDNNGWIDANDSILDSLRIWKKTDTKDELIALGEMGIGAIFLGYNEEDFNLKTQQNETLGRIRSNGLFLNEDGTSGIVSQIDLAKKDSKLSELVQSV